MKNTAIFARRILRDGIRINKKAIDKAAGQGDAIFKVQPRFIKFGTYLITGNIKHFPANIFVVTPRQFLHVFLYSLTDIPVSFLKSLLTYSGSSMPISEVIVLTDTDGFCFRITFILSIRARL